jgi:cytochrome c oxidase subunit 4
MHPVTPVRTYVIIWAILICFTFLTWGIAEYVDIGVGNIIVALLIALTKMTLVVLFFMHVKQDEPITKLFVAAGFFWVLILIALTLGDYQSRGWLPIPKMW